MLVLPRRLLKYSYPDPRSSADQNTSQHHYTSALLARSSDLSYKPPLANTQISNIHNQNQPRLKNERLLTGILLNLLPPSLLVLDLLLCRLDFVLRSYLMGSGIIGHGIRRLFLAGQGGCGLPGAVRSGLCHFGGEVRRWLGLGVRAAHPVGLRGLCEAMAVVELARLSYLAREYLGCEMSSTYEQVAETSRLVV